MEIFLSIAINILIFLIGYLIGSLNASIIVGKLFYKKDIREFHSKNAGATNSLRVFGYKVAIVILFIDIFKVVFATYFVRIVFPFVFSSKLYFYIPLIAGLAAQIGQAYPIYFKFRGGKGVAATVGLLISINVLLWPIAGVFFFLLLFKTKYASLSSLLTTLIMIGFISIPWMSQGVLSYATSGFGQFWVNIIIYLFAAALIFWKHRENIKRLLSKTENKMKFKK
ncbi:membrane protein [Mycoplasma synoviae GX11-T]|nr:glycerol-3-phosphate 1-O-acyltransferase PlsY [Mycoplasmopsis synoviae]MBD5788499.1 membrane protein [Mycoplasmopsis synoviae GX11-T]